MKFSKVQPVPVVLGISVALLGVWWAMWLGEMESQRVRQVAEVHVLQKLSTVRAAVERSLNERLYLTLGLRAYVSTNPNLTSDQFARYAASLMAEGRGIRSVTLIKDNEITDVYPRQGNESAIGVKLLDNLDQREDTLRAIKMNQPSLSGPVSLVQGGEAFVNRAPVYVTPKNGSPGSGEYWGLVSILIGKQSLFRDILKSIPKDLRLAIRGITDDTESHEYFYGESTIEKLRPLSLNVNLPTRDWQVVGVPIGGWPNNAPTASRLRWLGAIFSLATGALTMMLLQSNSNYRSARQLAESANLELSRKNEDLEAFVRTASHDLRSPLRHIRMFSELLAEDDGDRLVPDDHRHIEKIQHAISRMMNLLDSLLSFARVGDAAIKPRTLELTGLVEQVVNQLPTEKQDCVRFAGLGSVYGDATLLTQVLQNLIENGLKYHAGDDPQVTITSATIGNRIRISITDNGIGMNANQLKRIFQPGVRCVSDSEYAGSGFGLSICERIVKAHGGTIWVESQEGSGSTFFVELPHQSPTA